MNSSAASTGHSIYAVLSYVGSEAETRREQITAIGDERLRRPRSFVDSFRVSHVAKPVGPAELKQILMKEDGAAAMPLDERLMTIAHRLSSQGATLELEMYVLDSLGGDVEGTRVNLGRVADTLKDLAAEILRCVKEEE